MKIIVAIKQVPARDLAIRIAPHGKWIETHDLSFEINEPDAYALEAGLALKEKHGGEVVLLSVGPAQAAAAIRGALSKGADRAIHIESDGLEQLDALCVARLLAGAIRQENPDLILTGLQSDDLGQGQTGPVLAEVLGIPHAAIVMEVDAAEGSVRVKRELEDGWFQWLEMPLPALLTIQSGICRLRYATLMGIKKAKTKEIRRLSATPPDAPPSASLQRIYAPEKKKEMRLIAGGPAEAAARLVEVLRWELRVL